MWTVRYLAHNGVAREAHVALPRDLGPANNPAVPLIISPHGRGVTGRANLNFWGDLPARGRFAVISPEGHGRVLPLHSWGWARQIDDLANMQYVAKATLPWLRIKSHSVYAMGGSMGGQETLLLVARFNTLLAGVVALDSPTDLARRYRDFARLDDGRSLQESARREVGGVPEERARRLRAPQSDQLRARDRLLARAATDVLEHGGRDRAGPGAQLGCALPTNQRAEPGSSRDRRSRDLVTLGRHGVNLPRALQRFGLLPPGV